MNILTIPRARKYIRENYGQAKHNINKLVKATRTVAESNGVEPLDLFFLVIENKPIPGANTHNYGFHTAYGRHLITTTINTYYQKE